MKNILKLNEFIQTDIDIYLLKYLNMSYDKEGKIRMIKNSDCAHGVVFIKKSLIDILGGYQPWPCASDSELLIRGKEFLVEKNIEDVLFYRRIHSNSLTRNEEFGLKSKNREKYRNMIGKHGNVKIERIVNEYDEY